MPVAIWGRDEQGVWHLLPRLTASSSYCGLNNMRVLEMHVSEKPLDENVVCIECSRIERAHTTGAKRYTKPSRRCRACRSTDQLWKCRLCNVRCCLHRCFRLGPNVVCLECKTKEENNG